MKGCVCMCVYHCVYFFLTNAAIYPTMNVLKDTACMDVYYLVIFLHICMYEHAADKNQKESDEGLD